MRRTLSASVRSLPLGLLAVGLAVLLLSGGGSEDASAKHISGTGAVVVGFDMDTTNIGTGGTDGEGREDPADTTTGQGCNDTIDNDSDTAADGADTDCQNVGNASTSLGPIDQCVAVTAGASVTFDTFIDGIPTTAPDLVGFDYTILFSGALTAQNHATPGTTIIQPDFSFSETVPDSDGSHLVSEGDLFDPVVPAVGPEAGVLGRYTLDTTGLAAAVYPITIQSSSLILGNTTPAEWQLQVTDILPGFIAVDTACPTPTDVEVTAVTTASPPTADAGVPFSVTADVSLSNLGGADPVNVDTTIQLSLPGDCTTGDTNPVTVQDTSVSVAGSPVALTQQSWSVTCTDPSSHTFNTTATAVLDDTGAVESDLSNNELTSADDTTAVSDDGDVAVDTVTVGGPTSGTAGTAFTVTADVTVSNAGPTTPVNVDTTLTLTLPPDCSTTDTNPVTVQNTGVSSAAPLDLPQQSWDVTCTQRSDHTFTVDASTALDQIHVNDPNMADNTGSNNVVVPIFEEADLEKTMEVLAGDCTSAAPASISIDTNVDLCLVSSITNNGPGDTFFDDTVDAVSLPADCTVTGLPSGSTDNDINADETVEVLDVITVNCSEPSDHTLQFEDSVAISEVEVHVVDPDDTNNDAAAELVLAVTAETDLEIVSVAVGVPTTITADTAFDVTVDAVLLNNGPFGPVDATASVTLKVGSDCTIDPAGSQTDDATLEVDTETDMDTLTWSVTCTADGSHSFSADVGLSGQVHVNDTDTANNTVASAVLTRTIGPTPTGLPPTGGAAPFSSDSSMAGLIGGGTLLAVIAAASIFYARRRFGHDQQD